MSNNLEEISIWFSEKNSGKNWSVAEVFPKTFCEGVLRTVSEENSRIFSEALNEGMISAVIGTASECCPRNFWKKKILRKISEAFFMKYLGEIPKKKVCENSHKIFERIFREICAAEKFLRIKECPKKYLEEFT